VAVDPFVASRPDAAPRAKPAPGPAFRWRAERPGDLEAAAPRGTLFGSPGPDLGYALTLAKRFATRLRLAEREHRADAEAVAAEIGMRRSAGMGRAPTALDVEIGFTILGHLDDAPPDLVAWRRPRMRGAAHEYRQRRLLVDSVRPEVLELPIDALRSRVASDWRSLFAPDAAAPDAPDAAHDLAHEVAATEEGSGAAPA
jgi:hypothetical protein